MGGSETSKAGTTSFDGECYWQTQGKRQIKTAGVSLNQTEVQKTVKSLQRLSVTLARLGLGAQSARVVDTRVLALAQQDFATLLSSDQR